MGYAPGDYMGKCHVCGETKYDLDKRAWQCLECAARETKRVIEMLSARELELLQKVEKYGGLLIYFASDEHDVKADAVRGLAKNAIASAIDTQSATTDGRGPQDESAGPKGDAQTVQP